TLFGQWPVLEEHRTGAVHRHEGLAAVEAATDLAVAVWDHPSLAEAAALVERKGDDLELVPLLVVQREARPIGHPELAQALGHGLEQDIRLDALGEQRGDLAQQRWRRRRAATRDSEIVERRANGRPGAARPHGHSVTAARSARSAGAQSIASA